MHRVPLARGPLARASLARESLSLPANFAVVRHLPLPAHWIVN